MKGWGEKKNTAGRLKLETSEALVKNLRRRVDSGGEEGGGGGAAEGLMEMKLQCRNSASGAHR